MIGQKTSHNKNSVPQYNCGPLREIKTALVYYQAGYRAALRFRKKSLKVKISRRKMSKILNIFGDF